MLTIITPTLNASSTIENLLVSIRDQTENVEHLIIDGGSTDNTKDIVSRFSNSTYIEAKGSSIYEAQNIGIDNANGSYLYFIGADDSLYENDTISKMISEIQGSRVLHGKIEFPGLPTETLGARQQCFLYESSLFNQFGKYDISIPIYSDIDFQMRIFNKGIRCRITNQVFAKVADGGFSSRKDI